MKPVQAILQSARIAKLKMAAGLVKPRPHVELPPDARRRSVMLRLLLAAERRRSAALIEQLRH
jgi:hypothetical protein